MFSLLCLVYNCRQFGLVVERRPQSTKLLYAGPG